MKKYYAYSYNGDKHESPYQIRMAKSLINGKVLEPDGETLLQLFYGVFFSHRNPAFDYRACLEYHYDKYDGDKKEFVIVTKRLLFDAMEGTTKPNDQEIIEIIQTWHKDKTSHIKHSMFSVFEWATIFYYAVSADYFREYSSLKLKRDFFIRHHSLTTSDNSLKNEYYEAIKKINGSNEYPLKKLEKIIPFLQQNYPKSVSFIENDISFLKEEAEN